MQKLLRTIVVLLLLVVVAAVVYSQLQIYAPLHSSSVSEKIADIAARRDSSAVSRPLVVPAAPVTPAASGTEASPVVVKLVPSPEPEERIAEREQDRQIQRGIEHYASRIAATSLAENFLQLFQAIIYFLTLIIIFMLMENVRKFADAAAKSAEAARKSAEIAQALLAKPEKPATAAKQPPHYYRKR